MEFNYKDGKLHGKKIYFNKLGNQAKVEFYKNGEIDKTINYHTNLDQKFREFNYVDGKFNGKHTDFD